MQTQGYEMVACPECGGRGDIPFYTWEGDKEWDVCFECKGAKLIPMKIKLPIPSKEKPEST